MAGNQFFRNTFFPFDQHQQSLTRQIQQRDFSKLLSYDINYERNNLSKSTNSKQNTKKYQKVPYSLKTSMNQLKSTFDSFQSQIQKKQCRFLSVLEKRNFESSLQQVSPWDVNYTKNQTPKIKKDFTKERQKIKQMIYAYRLNKTIDQNVKDHANFIKNTKNKKKKINMVLLEYEKDSKTIQRPLSLIKSVDVNKSYESYLNNDLNLDKNLFKIPIKMKNPYRKQISSCRMYTKESQKEKCKTLREQLNEMIKEDLTSTNLLNELKNNLSRQDLLKQNDKQKPIQLNKTVQKAIILRNERTKKGLINQRHQRSNRQEAGLNSKSLIKEEKLQFSISGNKTHKLQYQSRQGHID